MCILLLAGSACGGGAGSVIEEVPEGPLIIIANEFFDALPVFQAVKQEDGWHERLVGIDGDSSGV